MTPPPIPGPAGRVTALHARKCVRHPVREAAARCPACGECFCRECVVEHEGKVLCGPCLARRATRGAARRERWRGLRHAGRSAAGLLALWLVFYGLGALLAKLPPEVHDGTVWRRAADASPR